MTMRHAHTTTPVRSHPLAREIRSRFAAWLPFLVTLTAATAALAAPSKRDLKGAPVLGTDPLATALVRFYHEFGQDRDLEAFHKKVSARYTPATLERVLVMGTTEVRQGAGLALSLIGDFGSREAVGKALRDPDPVVSRLAS